MSSWAWIVIVCALFLFSLKAILWLGLRRYIKKMHAEFIAYMKTRSPHLVLVDRADRIELRVEGKKVASVVWRFLYKRLSELPKEMPNRHMTAFVRFAAFIEEVVEKPRSDYADCRKLVAPRIALPAFTGETEQSGILVPYERVLDSRLAVTFAVDGKDHIVYMTPEIWNQRHEYLSIPKS